MCTFVFFSACMMLDHNVALFSVRLRSLTDGCCCCVKLGVCSSLGVCFLFVLLRLRIAKKINEVQYTLFNLP